MGEGTSKGRVKEILRRNAGTYPNNALTRS